MSAASSCRSSSAWGIDLASAELVFAGPDIDLYQPRREPGSSRVDQISYRRCRPETPPGFADSDRGACCRGYPDSSPDLLHSDSPAEHVGTAVARRAADQRTAAYRTVARLILHRKRYCIAR